MANLYDKAGLVNIPVGYQDGFLYNIKPEDNTLGFRFNRDSAATRVNKEGLIEQVGYFGPELVQNGNFSELGPELVVNGDFATDSDWTKTASWEISNGVAYITSPYAPSYLYQGLGLIVGRIYKIEIDIVSLSSGNIRLRCGNSAPSQSISDWIGTLGKHTIYLICGGLGDIFWIESDNSFIGSIDNVSVKEVGQNWDFGTGWSIEDGVVSANAPTGNLSQILNATSGSKYRVTFTISNYVSGDIRWRFTGTSNENGTLRSANGTYTEEITLTNNQAIFLFPSTGGVMDIDNVSAVEVLGDKPRIDYTDSLTSPSFLLEPQSTNLISYSEDFSQSYWIKDNVLIESGYTAPDGGNNAYKVTKNGGNAHLIVLGSTVSSLNRHKSIWARTVSGTGTVQLLNHNSDTSNIFTLTTQWQRFDIAHGGLFNHFYAVDFRGAGTTLDEVIIWGAQLEDQSYPTSYIPTAGSTATRAQETCIGAGSASTFNDSEGVLYAEISSFKNGGIGDRTISINDGSTQNAVQLLLHNTANRINFRVRDGGSLEVNISDFTFTQDQINKIACKYKAGDYALWINGEQKVTTTSGSLPSGLSKLSFNDGSLNDFYGKTKGVYVFNEALTDDELQQLTT